MTNLKRKISKEEAEEIADMLLGVIKMKKKMEEIENLSVRRQFV